MPTTLSNAREYQDIFHWAETQKDGSVPSFATRKNDPYEVRRYYNSFVQQRLTDCSITPVSTTSNSRVQKHTNLLPLIPSSFASEAVPGTLPQGQNSPRNVRFGLYAEQMTASAFVAPRHLNKRAWLYRARPSVAHQGFVSATDIRVSNTANNVQDEPSG